MMRRGWYLVAACVAALTITSNTAQAGGHVYALRGLIGVFSQGMDEMVAKCKQRGIQASAHGHGEFISLAADAAAKAKSGKGPIIIIGHSYGADAAVYMAQEMKKLGAPVALLVLYGPTVNPLAIPSNVRAVVNYYQTTSAAWRGVAVKGPGFRGSINNVNLDKDSEVTHFNIEKVGRLQAQALSRIAGLTGTGRPIPTDTPATTASSDTVATPPSRAVTTGRAAVNPNGGTASSSRPAKPAKRSAASSSKTTVEAPASHGAY
jgi:pimeloyl-ACP methyl ester carboxylesterase